jgi:5-methyltetrahydrofolate--homocysteine methyltransferase
MTRDERLNALEKRARGHVLVNDGGWGTEIQALRLSEEDYRGERFAGWNRPLKGNNDLLNLTRPEAVTAIHNAYFDAGADFAESNTFCATSIAQADYGLEEYAPEIAREGARLARASADAHETAERPRAVLGAIGPTNKTLSISPDVNDPGFRDIDFDAVAVAYRAQADAMAEFVDFFLIETIFDTMNAKAAIKALIDRRAETGEDIPLIVSGTITDASGRTLSGQTTEAFWNSIRHARPWAVGLNCALGAEQLRRYVDDLARVASTRVIAYPNAGLPNAFGEYDETPETTAAHLGEWAASGLVNAVGGCCGTTPAHIKAIAEVVADKAPRPLPGSVPAMRLSGLEPFELA